MSIISNKKRLFFRSPIFYATGGGGRGFDIPNMGPGPKFLLGEFFQKNEKKGRDKWGPREITPPFL